MRSRITQYLKLNIAICTLTLTLTGTAHALTRPFKVVIDPGHGGTDQGTIYRKGDSQIAEKDMTLAIAKLVTRKLKERGILAVLTRTRDQDVSLTDRTGLANRIGADAFISIHMNSTPQPGFGAEGIETYILNNATDASSKRLAHLENSVLGGHETVSPDNMDVALILKDLRLDANESESKRLACTIQRNLAQDGMGSGINDRGVKQALFHVLLGADMPSVLVEAGFLSNERDRTWIGSASGKQLISNAIANAVERYRHTLNTRESRIQLNTCKISGHS